MGKTKKCAECKFLHDINTCQNCKRAYRDMFKKRTIQDASEEEKANLKYFDRLEHMPKGKSCAECEYCREHSYLSFGYGIDTWVSDFYCTLIEKDSQKDKLMTVCPISPDFSEPFHVFKGDSFDFADVEKIK